MKTLSIAAIIAVSGLAAAPTFAHDDTRSDMIQGRSRLAVEAALRDRGIAVSSLEEWGTLIRAWVPDRTGGSMMLFFDPNTLERVTL